MRTLGHGNAEKEAACGALQWRRGEAPNAALRLSPTFAADIGQRTKPHAASATINARAKPHARAWRMLPIVSLPVRNLTGPHRLIARTDGQRDNGRRL